MNPNNFNTTDVGTNEPNEWDSLAEAADTGKEGEIPGDENDGWSVIDHLTDDSGTGIEKAGEETGTEKEGEETGDETAYTPPHAVDNTGMENMTGTEMEGYSDGTGEETGVENK